jgi:hypothetical protein
MEFVLFFLYDRSFVSDIDGHRLDELAGGQRKMHIEELYNCLLFPKFNYKSRSMRWVRVIA